MFKKNEAKTVEDYLLALPDERKEAVVFLHDFIRKTVPMLKPHFASNMLGYGSFEYVNYKKEKIDWPIIALANQKQYISIYICSVIDNEYLAEKYKDELGKVSVGRSCIRFKKLEHVNLAVLAKVLRLAAKKPGLPQKAV